MNTKALRQKILDLAIHGKLVPQDPNDESASVLLERIRAEKERLIKEGKIKKPKKAKATCDKPRYPFQLPEGWVWTTIEVISWDLLYGTSKKSSSTGKIPVLRMGNINRCGNIDWDNLVFTNDQEDIIKYSLQPNDLLFNRTNSSEWVGKTAIYKGEQEAIYAGYIVRLRTIILDADYVNFVMNSSYYRDWCNEVKTDAVNQSNINAQKLSQLYIPIPPLKEQKRIVNELSSWLTIIDNINSSKTELQIAIKQAKSKILDLAIHGKLVLQDPNDEPASELLKRINPKTEIICDNPRYGKLPDTWVWTKVRDVFSINPKNKAETTQIAGFVPMTNICEGFTNQFTYETKEWGKIKSGFTHFADGDIAVAKISPCLENRKSVVLRNLPNGIGAGTTELHVFRPLGVDTLYGLYFFKSDYFINNCVGTFNGVVGQQRVGKSIVEEISFPLPPLSEQHRIVAKIEELFAQLDKIEASL